MILYYAILIDEDKHEHVELRKTLDEAWDALFAMLKEWCDIVASSPEELDDVISGLPVSWSPIDYYVDEVLLPE